MSFEMKDLTGIGQPLTKLIEVISAGVGVIYRPRSIRKEAEAKAYAAKVIGFAENLVEADKALALTNAQVKGNLILADAAASLEERAQQRQIYKELQRQTNLEAIAEVATEQLAEEVSDTPVDEDWISRFFDIAQDISAVEMQRLWGRILAGEVANPGTYSLRTLEIIKNLKQEEATIFQRARYLSTSHGNILKSGEDLSKFGLSYDEILILREAGLMLDGDTININYEVPPAKFIVLSYNGVGLLMEGQNDQQLFSFPQYVLSKAGIELLELIEPQPNYEYLNSLGAYLLRQGIELSVGTLGQPKNLYKKLF